MRATQSQPIDAKSVKAKGFTLVELLAVISIIAMLMGILMPALAATQRLARKTICKLNLHNCGLAFRIYLDDNKNVMPFAAYFPTLPSLEEQELNLKPIGTVLAKYIGDPKVLKCPADTYIPDEYHNTNSTYFQEAGSSYQYNTGLGGIKLNGAQITFSCKGRSFTVLSRAVDVMRDYDSFHGEEGQAGSVMYLYADAME
jgi:prepilin-type N-terminal cleavage/methylation domain-containing protein